MYLPRGQAHPVALAVLGLLTVSLLTIAPSPPPASADAQTIRLLGDTVPPPVDMALLIQQATGVETEEEVVIGSADSFADALASGPLQADRPLLLVPPSGPVPLAVRERLVALGTGRALLLGGAAALSTEVEAELEGMGLAVERLAGDSRYATAVEVAEVAAPDATTALLVRAGGPGTSAFADALAVGAPAAINRWPVLLTDTDALPGATLAHLGSSRIGRVLVAGGPVAIGDAVLDELRDLGLEVERLSGEARDVTASEVGLRTVGGDPDRAILVDGAREDAWAAGFASARYAALLRAPVLLTAGDTAPPGTEDYIRRADALGEDTGMILHCITVQAACSAAATADDQIPQRILSTTVTTPAERTVEIGPDTWVSAGARPLDGQTESFALVVIGPDGAVLADHREFRPVGGAGPVFRTRVGGPHRIVLDPGREGIAPDTYLLEAVVPLPATGAAQAFEFGPAGALLSIDVPPGVMFTGGFSLGETAGSGCATVELIRDDGTPLERTAECGAIAAGGLSGFPAIAATGGRHIIAMEADGSPPRQGVVQGTVALRPGDDQPTEVPLGPAGALMTLDDLRAGTWFAGGATGTLSTSGGCGTAGTYGPDGRRLGQVIGCGVLLAGGLTSGLSRAETDGDHTVHVRFDGAHTQDGAVIEVTTPTLIDVGMTPDLDLGPAGLLVAVRSRAGDDLEIELTADLVGAEPPCGGLAVGLPDGTADRESSCGIGRADTSITRQHEVPTDADVPFHLRVDGALGGSVDVRLDRLQRSRRWPPPARTWR